MSKIVKSVGEFAGKRAGAVAEGCACNAQGWSFVATKAKCLPTKWATAKGEAKEIVGRYKSGEVTWGEFKQHVVYVLAGGLIFYAGEAVGRGSLVGYKQSARD